MGLLSFFGICEFDKDGKAKPAKQVTVPPSSVIRSLELIGILLSAPPLNRARGRFPDAEKVWQLEPKVAQGSTRYRVGEMLTQMASRISEMQNALAVKSRKVKKARAAHAR